VLFASACPKTKYGKLACPIRFKLAEEVSLTWFIDKDRGFVIFLTEIGVAMTGWLGAAALHLIGLIRRALE
jgi:hypothetical protein